MYKQTAINILWKFFSFFAVLSFLFHPLAACAAEFDFTLDTVLSGMAEQEPDCWMALCLARSGYLFPDDPYLTGFCNDAREEAASLTADSKPTDCARLILALTAAGQDAGDLTALYTDMAFTQKQGISGIVFALISLDCGQYRQEDTELREKLLDMILTSRLEDGGWAVSGDRSDPDMTAMALQALAPYKEEQEIQEAVRTGLAALSRMQNEEGCYVSWGMVSAASLAQVITACSALGVDAGSDPAFVKNGNSAISALLTFYDENAGMFCNTRDDGGNAMANVQAAYSLVAYDRFLKGENSLYDMTDVQQEEKADFRPVAFAVSLSAAVCALCLLIKRRRTR